MAARGGGVCGRRSWIRVGKRCRGREVVQHGVHGLRKPVAAAVDGGSDDTGQLQHGAGQQRHVYRLVIRALDRLTQPPSPWRYPDDLTGGGAGSDEPAQLLVHPIDGRQRPVVRGRSASVGDFRGARQDTLQDSQHPDARPAQHLQRVSRELSEMEQKLERETALHEETKRQLKAYIEYKGYN